MYLFYCTYALLTYDSYNLDKSSLDKLENYPPFDFLLL